MVDFFFPHSASVVVVDVVEMRMCHLVAEDLMYGADPVPGSLNEPALLVMIHDGGARGAGGILAAATFGIHEERAGRLCDVLARLATPAGLELRGIENKFDLVS